MDHSTVIFHLFLMYIVAPQNFHIIYMTHIFYVVCVWWKVDMNHSYVDKFVLMLFTPLIPVSHFTYDPWCQNVSNFFWLLKSQLVDIVTHRLSRDRQKSKTEILEPLWKRWSTVDDDIWDHISRWMPSVNGNQVWHIFIFWVSSILRGPNRA